MSESSSNSKRSDFCNLDYLLVRLGMNQAAADRLVKIFIENSPVLCQKLEKAATQGDLAALKDVLHDIRSNCVLFSGNRCLQQAREIEELVLENIPESRLSSATPDWHSVSAPLVLCLQCMAKDLAGLLPQKDDGSAT